MTKVFSDTIPDRYHGYLTPGKRYEIEWDDVAEKFGTIVADDGYEITIRIRRCPHLDRGDWTVEEEAEPATPTHSREYPLRIHAGHLGGGSRTWTPDPVDATEAAHSCEYVRADVVDALASATQRLLGSIYDHTEAGEVHPYHTVDTTGARSAILAVNPVKEPKA